MYATALLIAANITIYAASYIFYFDYQNLAILCGLNSGFFYGFYWQILSTMFLHASFMHLFMNMAILYQFGQILEKFLGTLRFVMLYIIGGMLTSILSLSYVYIKIRQGEFVNIVGASGAICVLLGLLAALDKQNAKGLFTALVIMSFAPLLVGVKIAWYAHLFGFAIGFGYGFIRFKR